MGLLDKLSRFFSPLGQKDEAVYWIYVRCNCCRGKLRTRINLYHDLSIDFNDGDESRFICRKTLVGSQRCFQRVEVVLLFNGQRKITEREISGGEFINEDEYFADEG